MRTVSPEVVSTVEAEALPIRGEPTDYDPLLDLIGDRPIVLLGEATHGTHEFYEERARITRRLIEEKGFTTIAVEADWPDAYRVNRYIRRMSDDANAQEALGDFRRFPLWMWRNSEIVELVEWLRGYNEGREDGVAEVGFYGLDLYSLHASIEAVLKYLDTADPEAARRARYRYACFDHFAEDSQAYGYAASFGLTPSCEDQAVAQLTELQRRAVELARRDGRIPADEYFFAEQNARLVRNSEEYYRTMFRSRVSSWNLRDRHMSETLDALLGYFNAKGQRTKVVVWAHNSHLGDARATEMGVRGEWNVGQLTRQKFGDDVRLIGFTTAVGTVTAASDWEAPAERKRVRAPLPDSYEAVFHQVETPNFLLPLVDPGAGRDLLAEPRLERAIGVIYRPESERISHYFEARLPAQFDAIIHFDETRALRPLDHFPGWHDADAPDTYPFNV